MGKPSAKRARNLRRRKRRNGLCRASEQKNAWYLRTNADRKIWSFRGFGTYTRPCSRRISGKLPPSSSITICPWARSPSRKAYPVRAFPIALPNAAGSWNRTKKSWGCCRSLKSSLRNAPVRRLSSRGGQSGCAPSIPNGAGSFPLWKKLLKIHGRTESLFIKIRNGRKIG